MTRFIGDMAPKEQRKTIATLAAVTALLLFPLTFATNVLGICDRLGYDLPLCREEPEDRHPTPSEDEKQPVTPASDAQPTQDPAVGRPEPVPTTIPTGEVVAEFSDCNHYYLQGGAFRPGDERQRSSRLAELRDLVATMQPPADVRVMLAGTRCGFRDPDLSYIVIGPFDSEPLAAQACSAVVARVLQTSWGAADEDAVPFYRLPGSDDSKYCPGHPKA